MAKTVELYLRDQVLRGQLRSEPDSRVLDVLNDALSGVLWLDDARTRSVHNQAPPSRIGHTRVLRTQIQFVVPHDDRPEGPRRLRAAFIEKRMRPAAVGVGPYFVDGTIHVAQYDHQLLDLSVAHTTSGRLFVPFTHARVTSQFDPDWMLDLDVVLVNRQAVAFVCPPAAL